MHSGERKKFTWYGATAGAIILLMLVTVQIYSIEENNIKTTIIENHIQVQEVITKSISKNIGSELEMILLELSLLAESEEIQDDIGTRESSVTIEQSFNRLNAISPTAQILALDKDFVVLSQASKSHNSFVGATVRGLSELIDAESGETKTDSKIMSINTPLFDEPEIAITFPITDAETGLLKGLLLVTFPSSEFFKRHGNIYDIESQFLMVMDENNILLIHPNMENVGKSFFEEEIQKNIGSNQLFNEHISHVLEGNLSTVIFTLDEDDGIGERVHSGIPVSVNGKDEFMFGVVTPTQAINQEIDDIIFLTKVQTAFLLLSTIAVLVALLLKRTQSMEREKMTVIGQLSSNIAHDIRNPLGTIKNAGVIIGKENNEANQAITREINRINLSVRRISHQIEEVLNYVRTTPIILKPQSIIQTIRDAAATLDIHSGITIDIPKDDIVARFDSSKMIIVFVNIMLNAVQAIGQDRGTITVRLNESQNFFTVEFENSGPGIPEKDLKRIFDTLFTTKLEGTGLGLSSCKNIIEQHGGTIQATTNPVTFSIRLPK